MKDTGDTAMLSPHLGIILIMLMRKQKKRRNSYPSNTATMNETNAEIHPSSMCLQSMLCFSVYSLVSNRFFSRNPLQGFHNILKLLGIDTMRAVTQNFEGRASV